jgi:hypothetical protein
MLNQLIDVHSLVVVGSAFSRNDDFPVPMAIAIHTTYKIRMEINPVQSLQYSARRS